MTLFQNNNDFGFAISSKVKRNMKSPEDKLKALEIKAVGLSNYLKSGSNNTTAININVDLKVSEIRKIFLDFTSKEENIKNVILTGTREDVQNCISENKLIIERYAGIESIELSDFYEILMLCIGYLRSDTLMDEVVESEYYPHSEFLAYFNENILGAISNNIE